MKRLDDLAHRDEGHFSFGALTIGLVSLPFQTLQCFRLRFVVRLQQANLSQTPRFMNLILTGDVKLKPLRDFTTVQR